MRTVTAGEQTLLEGAEYSVHAVVRCEDPDGTMVRMDTLQGHNWIKSIRWGESVDQPVMAGDIIFARTQEDPSDVLSLEPLDQSSVINRNSGASYARFLDEGRDVDVYVATVTLGGAKPSFPGSDWQHVVSGVTDRWFNPEGGIGIRFRDRIGAELYDQWIRVPTIYGADDGSELLEDVIQEILTGWTSGYTLEVPTASAFAIREYEQQEMRVLDAIRILAQLRGWDVRVRWNNSGNDFRVTLYEPNRTPSGTDWSFAENRVIGVRALEEDRESVRNVIVVSYPGPGSPLTRTDATSVAKFGERFLGIVEGADSPIDSSAKAVTFADAILDDLKDPVADQEIEKMLWWPGEVGDYYQFQPLRPFYDVNQEFGVTAIRHEVEIEPDKARHRTFIRTRGKPAGANEELHRLSEFSDDRLDLLINDAKWTPLPKFNAIGGFASYVAAITSNPAYRLYYGEERGHFMDVMVGEVGEAAQVVKVEVYRNGVAVQQAYYQSLAGGEVRIRVRMSDAGVFTDFVGADGQGDARNFLVGDDDWEVWLTPFVGAITDQGLTNTQDLRDVGINWAAADQVTEADLGARGETRKVPLGKTAEEGYGQTFEPHRPDGPPEGGPDEQFIVGTSLIGRPALDFDQESTTGRPQLRMRLPYSNGPVAGTWEPTYRRGPVQEVTLVGTTTILPPSDMDPGETLHLFVNTNGYDFRLGLGFVVPSGIKVPRSGRCHCNFAKNSLGEVSGLVLSNMLPESIT